MPSCPAGTAATIRPIEIASMCCIMRYTRECTHTIISLGCGRLMLRYMQCYLPWSSQTLPQKLLLSVLPSNNWFNWLPWTMVRVPLDKEELELTLEHESPTISPRSNAVNMKTFATPSWQVRCWDTYSFELHIKHFGPIWDPLLISMQWVPSDNQPLTAQPLPLQVANGDWCTVDKDSA